MGTHRSLTAPRELDAFFKEGYPKANCCLTSRPRQTYTYGVDCQTLPWSSIDSMIFAGYIALMLLQGEVQLEQLELTDLASVRAFADRVHREGRIDSLILNAGEFAAPLTYTKHGWELHMGTNFLAHFYLAQLLAPKLIAQVRLCHAFLTFCFAILCAILALIVPAGFSLPHCGALVLLAQHWGNKSGRPSLPVQVPTSGVKHASECKQKCLSIVPICAHSYCIY